MLTIVITLVKTFSLFWLALNRPNNSPPIAASQAIAFAKEHKLMAYLECSSLLHINTREIVDECTLLMLTRHKAIKKLRKAETTSCPLG